MHGTYIIYVLIQAIEALPKPCRYSEDGCDFTDVEKDIMSEHENNCKFRKIQCPEWRCKDWVPLERILGHVNSKHADSSITPGYGGGGHTGYSIFWGKETDDSVTSRLASFYFAGQTFLPICVIEKGIWRNWVVIVGDEKEAARFEVVIKIPTKEVATLTMVFKAKVYSILEDRKDYQTDAEGILEYTKNMADKMFERDVDGKLGIRANYHIYRRDHKMAFQPTQSSSVQRPTMVGWGPQPPPPGPPPPNMPPLGHPLYLPPPPPHLPSNPPLNPAFMAEVVRQLQGMSLPQQGVGMPNPETAPVWWKCHKCTFNNNNIQFPDVCNMCGELRKKSPSPPHRGNICRK